MGASRTTTQETQQTRTQTPQQKEFTNLELEARKAAQEGIISTQGAGLKLIESILKGGQLPGFFEGLPSGITPDITNELASQAVADITPNLFARGLGDGGVAASVQGRVSGDIRRAVAETNLNRLFNLLYIGVGSKAQTLQPILGASANTQRALTPFGTTTGSSRSTLRFNPFLESFGSSFGKSLGKATGGGVSGFVGGLF